MRRRRLRTLSPRSSSRGTCAKALFDTEDVVGKTFYDGLGQSATIVGVIEHMHGAWVGWDKLAQVVLFTRIVAPRPFVRYVVRTEPGRRDALMPSSRQKLTRFEPAHVSSAGCIRMTTTSSAATRPTRAWRSLAQRSDRSPCDHDALGIFGLATFNVNTRVSRSARAARWARASIDIVRYFMVENWMLTTAGVAVGCCSRLHGLLAEHGLQLPRLELYYLMTACPAIWILGQLAALVPARRAASVPPAVATRTV